MVVSDQKREDDNSFADAFERQLLEGETVKKRETAEGKSTAGKRNQIINVSRGIDSTLKHFLDMPQ